MLSAEDIRHGFDGRDVLRGVSLRLAPGEVLGIGGASGAGKSTLGRILAGRTRPEGGRVRWQGSGLPDRGPCPVQHAPQSPDAATDPRWPVAKILKNGGPPDAGALAALGIRPDWHRRLPGELSGGELARVSLARMIRPETRVLICDEITAQLDALAARDLWQALLPLARARGMALIVISHDAGLRRALAARDTVLTDGRLCPA
ncbi:ABC transporter ATP-binding protein [Rhodovulum viride]|uniref:ABC transporter ATP-binding protein n=1 Tax=Rhodovulum viride TaxID=1231134 RepID=A0ABX9DMA3_9RHOB|nr:ATP-binding cassette domain-containing protein [Rhodovulum viride]RAP42710.1 ABC transporter ATP-binding protein [Rhodovulum viride]